METANGHSGRTQKRREDLEQFLAGAGLDSVHSHLNSKVLPHFQEELPVSCC